MEKVQNFIKSHLDFYFYDVTWIALFVGLEIIPCLMYMPQRYGYENGLIENIQMFVLFVIFGLCLTSKVNKGFFRFCALAITLIIIREVNFGRTLFFPIPESSPLYSEFHQYYSWRELPWKWLGKLVHTLYSLYIAFVAFIFLKNKFYLDIWNMVKNIRFPFWNVLFACIAMYAGAVAEKLTNNNYLFEEGFELLFYVSLLGIIWLYTRNENFIITKE